MATPIDYELEARRICDGIDAMPFLQRVAWLMVACRSDMVLLTTLNMHQAAMDISTGLARLAEKHGTGSIPDILEGELGQDASYKAVTPIARSLIGALPDAAT